MNYMNDMVKILMGSINVAARLKGCIYVGTGLPLCDSDGVEWQDMSPEVRWDLCVAHLRTQDKKYDQLLIELNERGAKQNAPDFILFSYDTAIRLFNATQDVCIADVMEIARVQSAHDISDAISWLYDQENHLWDKLFAPAIVITENPLKR